MNDNWGQMELWPDSNSREEYEKTLAYAKEHRYWGMVTALIEDGYTSDVNWASLREEG